MDRTVISDCSLNSLTSRLGNLKVAPNNAASFHTGVSFDCCRKTNMSVRYKKNNNNWLVYGYFVYNVTKRRGGFAPHMESGLKSCHSRSPASSSAGTAADVHCDNSGHEEQLLNATNFSELKNVGVRKLKLASGSCYLPHPDKEETGDEDAHFICTDKQAIGVADGVGDEPKGSIDSTRVLEKAHSSTKSRGSSTACIVALTAQGVNTINLGDSGFIVVRAGCVVFRSPVQQHDFNFTYQLESGNGGDLPSSGQETCL